MEKQLHDLGFDIFLETSFQSLNENLKEILIELYPTREFHNKKFFLIGSSGDQIWKRVKNINAPHRLDNYTTDCIKKNFPAISSSDILYPTKSKVHFPILSVAQDLGFCHPTPIGIHINQNYGLWFSFRAVLVAEMINNVEELSSFRTLEKSLSPCDNCMDKPCAKEHEFWNSRSACPVKKELRYEQEFINYLKQEIILAIKSS